MDRQPHYEGTWWRTSNPANQSRRRDRSQACLSVLQTIKGCFVKILVVEDDYLQVSYLEVLLRQAIEGATVESIGTEAEFRQGFEKVAEDPPACILMDVMLPWTIPGIDAAPAPREVREGGFFRAGLRCQELLANDPRTRRIPVIFYTVLENSDLKLAAPQFPEKVRYLRKDSDDLDLIGLIQDLTGFR